MKKILASALVLLSVTACSSGASQTTAQTVAATTAQTTAAQTSAPSTTAPVTSPATLASTTSASTQAAITTSEDYWVEWTLEDFESRFGDTYEIEADKIQKRIILTPKDKEYANFISQMAVYAPGDEEYQKNWTDLRDLWPLISNLTGANLPDYSVAMANPIKPDEFYLIAAKGELLYDYVEERFGDISKLPAQPQLPGDPEEPMEPENPTTPEEPTSPLVPNPDSGIYMFEIGETLSVTNSEGEYELTIEGVRVTKKRNQFSEIKPKKVIFLDYNYKNINIEDGVYVYEGDFNVIDAEGNICDTYPVDDDTRNAKEVPPGVKSKGTGAYAIVTDSDYVTIQITSGWGKVIGQTTVQLTK